MCRHPLVALGFGTRLQLHPLEKAVLAALIARSDVSERAIIGQQMTELNLVERIHRPRTTVYFHRLEGPSVSSKRCMKFASTEEEAKLARLEFRIAETMYRVDVIAAYGNLYSWRFSTDMSRLLNARQIEFEMAPCHCTME